MAKMSREIHDVLGQIRPLTAEQFDRCETIATTRIHEKNGTKKNRQDFSREFAPLLGPTDYIGILLFAVLLLFSIVHLVSWSRNEAQISYNHNTAAIIQALPESADGVEIEAEDLLGVVLSEQTYIIAHQIAIIGLSEVGTIFFSVLHAEAVRRRRSKKVEQQPGKKPSFADWFAGVFTWYIVAAFFCAVVVFMANMSSGFNILVGFLVPCLTLLLGERVSEVISEFIRRREVITQRFEAYQLEWENTNMYPERQENYQRYLGDAIWDYYRNNIAPKYKEINWSLNGLSVFLARREIRNATRMDALGELLTAPDEVEPEKEVVAFPTPAVTDPEEVINPENLPPTSTD